MYACQVFEKNGQMEKRIKKLDIVHFFCQNRWPLASIGPKMFDYPKFMEFLSLKSIEGFLFIFWIIFALILLHLISAHSYVVKIIRGVLV